MGIIHKNRTSEKTSKHVHLVKISSNQALVRIRLHTTHKEDNMLMLTISQSQLKYENKPYAGICIRHTCTLSVIVDIDVILDVKKPLKNPNIFPTLQKLNDSICNPNHLTLS